MLSKILPFRGAKREDFFKIPKSLIVNPLLSFVFDNLRLTNYGYLDLTGIFELFFNSRGYFLGHFLGVQVRHFGWSDKDSDFSAGLKGVGLFNTRSEEHTSELQSQ